MTITDCIFLAASICLIVAAAVYMLRANTGDIYEVIPESSYMNMLRETGEMLNNYSDFGHNANHVAAVISQAVRTCNGGNESSREIVKNVINDWLAHERRESKAAMIKCIEESGNFGILETMICIKEREHKAYAFKSLWDEYFKEIALNRSCISAEDLKEYLRRLLKTNPELTDDEIRKILTNCLYSMSVGLGVIDSIMWQKGCIEEIQVGMSGHAEELYDYRNELKKLEGKEIAKDLYGKDSVHILADGITAKLSFLSFGTEEEMIRVIRNLAGSSQKGELTGKNPRTVTETTDGRRISVTRPPFSDAWAALIRKFDTVPGTDLSKLIGDPGLLKLIYELIRTRRSIAVTGEMAAGKTTLLRALLMEAGKNKSIRVVESESLELKIREYMPEANTLTLRVSKEHTAENVLEFAKKTTGQIFAVGEVTSQWMAVMLTDISKTAGMILFTAHYRSTEQMVDDFMNARLTAGGYSDEQMARREALNALSIDIHVANDDGVRKIQYINEVKENGKIERLWG